MNPDDRPDRPQPRPEDRTSPRSSRAQPPQPNKPPRPPTPPKGPRAPNARRALGIEGEARAAAFLEARGYRIVAQNVRADRVEIDLIARRGPLLVFVEVKARRSDRYGSAASAVDERKQQRLRRGAQAWLASRPEAARGWRRLRFDVVTCLAPAHIPTAAPIETPRSENEASNETTAPERARWQIKHWQSAF